MIAMKSRLTKCVTKSLPAAFGLCLLLALTPSSSAEFFDLPGAYFYRGINVFDVDSDGSIAVNLTNGDDNAHDAVVRTFNPRTGEQLSRKIAGFGPAEVRLTKTVRGMRVVALTTEGGPSSVTIFKVRDSGKLVQIAKTRLTDSNTDERTNIVFGPDGLIGFIIVPTLGTSDHQMVAFNVETGAIVSRTIVPRSNGLIGITSLQDRSLLLYSRFFPESVLAVIDVTNASEPRETGTVQLPRGASQSTFSDITSFAFLGDLVFVANSFFDFAIVDLSTLHLVSSGFADEMVISVQGFRDQSNRLMLLTETNSGSSQSIRWLVLVDASNPENLIELGRYQSNVKPTDYSVGAAGDRVYVAFETGLRVLRLPGFGVIWETEIPNPQGNIAFLVKTFGQLEQVISTWGIFKSTFGSWVVPEIAVIGTEGRHLKIEGTYFEPGAKIVINGTPWKTLVDENDTGSLFARKLLKNFTTGQVVAVQVRNPSGAVTPAVSFIIP